MLPHRSKSDEIIPLMKSRYIAKARSILFIL